MRGLDIEMVLALYRPSRGDTILYVGGDPMPFAEVYPIDSSYLVDSPPLITLWNRQYERHGGTRNLERHTVRRVAQHQSVGVFAITEDPLVRPRFIYLPVRTGCVFQPYRRQ
jgi:hypothetical protein